MRPRFMTRILLFVLTNLAVLAVVLRLLGVERILDEQGVGLDYRALLILSAVIGFGGAFVSLAMSKWIAKRSMGAPVIETRAARRKPGCSPRCGGSPAKRASACRRWRSTRATT